MSDMLEPLEPRFPFELEPRELEPNRSPNPLPLIELLQRVREDASGRTELTDDERDQFNALVTRTYPEFQTRFRPTDLDDADQRLWEIIEPDLADARKFDRLLFPVPRRPVPDKERWLRGTLENLARHLQGLPAGADLMDTSLARGRVEFTPLRAARLLLNLLRLGKEFDPQIETLAASLRERPGPIGRGVVLLYLGTFDKFDEAFSLGYEPRGTNPFALEEEIYANLGLSFGFTYQGDPREGYALVRGAIVNTKRLDMPGRRNFLDLERVRVLMLDQRPDLALARGLRGAPHLTVKQSVYAESLYVDHLMMFGGYAEAHAVVATLDIEMASSREAFLAALLRRPEPERATVDKNFGVLARAVRALHAGATSVELTPINNTVALGYSRLLEVIALARVPRSVGQAASALGQVHPAYADQKLWWALVALDVSARGAALPEVFDPRELLREAAVELEQGAEDVFMAARLLVPLGVALAGLISEAPAAAARALTATPVLTGKMLEYEGREIETKGSNGPSLVYEALGDARAHLLEKRPRFDEAIARLNLPVAPLNLGTVVMGARFLAERAREAGVESGVTLWREVEKRATSMLTLEPRRRVAVREDEPGGDGQT